MEQGDRRLQSNDYAGRAAGYKPRPVARVQSRYRTNGTRKEQPATNRAPVIVADDVIKPRLNQHILHKAQQTTSKNTVNVRNALPTHQNTPATDKAPRAPANIVEGFASRIPRLSAPKEHVMQSVHLKQATKQLSHNVFHAGLGHEHMVSPVKSTSVHNGRQMQVYKDYSVKKVPSSYVSVNRDSIGAKKIPTLPVPNKSKLHNFAAKTKLMPLRKKRGYGLVGLALALFMIGLSVNINSFQVTKKIEAQTAQTEGAVDGETSSRPGVNAGYSEKQPSASTIKQYAVAADLPKYVSIDSLGVWSRVIRVGVDAKNQIGSPKNVFDTAWYEGSSKPGQPGAAFINGHVLGPTKGGVFAGLSKIKVGAKVTITMGNNTVYTYRVVATEKVDADKVDMNKVLLPYDPAKQGLNLMTCNGKYIKDKETFDKRFIVYTVRES